MQVPLACVTVPNLVAIAQTVYVPVAGIPLPWDGTDLQNTLLPVTAPYLDVLVKRYEGKEIRRKNWSFVSRLSRSPRSSELTGIDRVPNFLLVIHGPNSYAIAFRKKRQFRTKNATFPYLSRVFSARTECFPWNFVTPVENEKKTTVLALHTDSGKWHINIVFHTDEQQQETLLLLTNLRDAFRGQSRSPNMVPFHMLDIVSYCAIITSSLRRAVFTIFNFKKCRDLEIGVKGH